VAGVFSKAQFPTSTGGACNASFGLDYLRRPNDSTP
jgi:hypothetical protein